VEIDALKHEYFTTLPLPAKPSEFRAQSRAGGTVALATGTKPSCHGIRVKTVDVVMMVGIVGEEVVDTIILEAVQANHQ